MPLFEPFFSPEEFTARRRKILAGIGDALALIPGAPPAPRSEPFRQTNEFYYLCGVEVPRCVLLLDGRDRHSTLFLPPRDERQERNEGPGLAAEDETQLRKWTGVDAVLPLNRLGEALARAQIFYIPEAPAEGTMMYRDELIHRQRSLATDPWFHERSQEAILKDRLRSLYSGREIRNLSPLLDEVRLVKSPREIERLRFAGALTARAVTEAMRSTRPGVRESQLGAIADYFFRVDGAFGGSYRPIIATGSNIWYTHYGRADATLTGGELVLMDYAPDYRYYTSDIGRTWPVNGRFSPVQRELYGLVTHWHQELLQRIRPGVSPEQVMEETARVMKPVTKQTEFSKQVYRAAAERLLEFKGHLSHPVGMAVHDVGDYRGKTMEPGLVISVDPQMWIPEEKLYIRVEDTVALTETGIENFTAGAPLLLNFIEQNVGAGGLLERFPPMTPPGDSPPAMEPRAG